MTRRQSSRVSAVLAALRRFAMCACVVIVATESSSLGQQDGGGAVSVEELLRIWKEREDAVESFRAEYRETRTIPKGMLLLGGRGGRSFDDDGNPFPPEDTTIELELTLTFQGRRWRYDRNGPTWVQEAEEFIEQQYVQMFDGETYLKHYGTQEYSDEAHPNAYITPADGPRANTFGASSTIWPFFICFRNTQEKFQGVSSDRWRVGSSVIVIDDHQCFLIEQFDPPGGPVFHRCWIDPQQGYSIVRREMGEGEIVTSKVDIRYREDPEWGWVPSDWSRIAMVVGGDGTTYVEHTSEFVVDHVEFNPELAPDVLHFKIPDGTWVADFTRSDERVNYLVQTDEGEREITDEELSRGATYEELRETESGTARVPVRTNTVYWPYVIGIASIMALIWAWLARSR